MKKKADEIPEFSPDTELRNIPDERLVPALQSYLRSQYEEEFDIETYGGFVETMLNKIRGTGTTLEHTASIIHRQHHGHKFTYGPRGILHPI